MPGRISWLGRAVGVYALGAAVVCAGLVSAASAAVTDMRITQVDNTGAPELDGYVTQDVLIDFGGRWTGCQMRIDLDNGTIYQDAFGVDTPPSAVVIGFAPSLAYDTFVAGGGATQDDALVPIGITGGAVDLGGEPTAQFDETRINFAWHPQPGLKIENQTDFLAARVSLSDDAAGTWSFLASDGEISTYGGPIDNGLPEPATVALLAVGGSGLLRRRKRRMA